MPPPDLQMYLRSRVTLTFDLLTPKVDRFMPYPEPLVPNGIKVGSPVLKISCSQVRYFTNVTRHSLTGTHALVKRGISNELEWLSKIFNDTMHRAVFLRQLRFLFYV